MRRQVADSSVEDILESIKKVITPEGRTVAGEETVQRFAPQPVVAPVSDFVPDDDSDDDEVLDLAEAESYGDEQVEPLMATYAVNTTRDTLAALANLSAGTAAPQPVRTEQPTLEGAVKDMLRPMLAEWLDRNLPPMVEQLVAAEIARIVGKNG